MLRRGRGPVRATVVASVLCAGCNDATGGVDLVSVTVPWCAAASLSAYRNAGADWTPVTSPSYRQPVEIRTTETVELFHRGSSSGFLVMRVTPDDIREITCIPLPPGPEAGYTLTAAGKTSAESYSISVGRLTDVGFIPPEIRPGPPPFDLVAYVHQASTMRAMIVRRSLSPQAGSALAPLDFAGTEALSPAAMPATIDAPATHELRSISVTLLTPNGTRAALRSPSSDAAALDLPRLPAVQSHSADEYEILARYFGTGGTPERHVVGWFSADAPRTLTLGPLPAALAPTTVPLSATIVTYSATAPVDPAYDGYASVLYDCTSGSGSGRVGAFGAVLVTRAYRTAKGQAGWELDLPDMRPHGATMLNPSVGACTWTLSATSGSLADFYVAQGGLMFARRPVGSVVRRFFLSGSLE